MQGAAESQGAEYARGRPGDPGEERGPWIRDAQVPPEGLARKKRTQLSDFFLFFLSQTFWRKKCKFHQKMKSYQKSLIHTKRENIVC